MSKVAAHTIYKDEKGKRLPGVTTILGILEKKGLVDWSNNLGLNGINVHKYVDDKAEIGTLAHYLVMCHLTGEEPDTDDYSQNQIVQANNSFQHYMEWEREHTVEPILVEGALVSNVFGYGGTLDLYCKLDGVLTLLDIKTGNGIYDSYFFQLAAYKHLLEEQGCGVDGCRILRIGRDETEGFEERVAGNLDLHFELFKHCLQIYDLQKVLRRKS